MQHLLVGNTFAENKCSQDTSFWRRQEAPHCTSLSFNRHAANAFQQYVMAAHAFSIKRGGILYGTVQEGGEVLVEAIYEPPQVPH